MRAKGKTGPSSKLRFVVAAQAHRMFGPEMSQFLLDGGLGAVGKTGPSSKLRFVVAAHAHCMFGPEMSNFKESCRNKI
jgi:hypothetical protein